MNHSTSITAAAISIVYLLMRFLDMRFVQKDSKPLKTFAKDGIIVFMSVFTGGFLLNQLDPSSLGSGAVTEIFTDSPAF